MIITDGNEGIGMPATEVKSGDVLNCDVINSLPHPLTVRLFGGGEWELETLCVQTALMRFYVGGLVQCGCLSDVSAVMDSDGNEHDPDTLWMDYQE